MFYLMFLWLHVVYSVAGLDAFIKFLRSEFSEENIEFWMACEEYKKIKDAFQLLLKAKTIYETFIETESPKEVQWK